MLDVIDLFDNREKATVFWTFVVVLGALCVRDVRPHAWALVRTLFGSSVLVAFLSAAAWVGAIVALLAWIDVWSTAVLDVTIFWFLTAGVAAVFTAGSKAGDPSLLRRLLAASVTWVLLVEFVSNLYVFSLVVELILLPVLAFVVAMNVFAGMKPEFASVKAVTDVALRAFGIFLLVRATWIVATDPAGFTTSENAMRFLTPIVLSFAFLPFAYLLAVYALYNSAFARLNAMSKDAARAAFARRTMLREFRADRMRLARFAGQGVMSISRAGSKKEIEDVIRRFEIPHLR